MFISAMLFLYFLNKLKQNSMGAAPTTFELKYMLFMFSSAITCHNYYLCIFKNAGRFKQGAT